MNDAPKPLVERIQALAARLLATTPPGQQLCLIGGLRYRLLDASCRASIDLDYHWEGDLDEKRAEILELLRKRLLPEVKRQFGYEGDVGAASGEEAESPAVRILEMAFYRPDRPGSRIEIPLEITTIARLDPPVVRTVAGTVFLTVSDADMIEGKVIAILNRRFVQSRDFVDIFLFQDTLRPDSPQRLSRKFPGVGMATVDAAARLIALEANRTVHVRGIERVLGDQVEPAVTANLRAAGGAEMVFDTVVHRLQELLRAMGGPQP